MNVLVAGGGTGGHLYPALAFIEGLRRRYGDEVRVGYIGTERGLEAQVLSRFPEIEFFKIQARGFERHLSIQTVWALGQNVLGLAQALRAIINFRPRVILGTGGYVSFAPIVCGIALRIPTLIHEQNVLPGLVNRLLARWVDGVMLSYPDTARSLWAKRWVVTGVPVRPSLMEARTLLAPREAKRLCGLDPGRATVLVLGGSHGARVLHDRLLEGHERLQRAGVQLVLVAGRDAARLKARLQPGVVVLQHTSEIGVWMRAADLVLCRAGGVTLAELMAMGVPAIVIPWPGSSENHQEQNALWLAERGGCRLLFEDQLREISLIDEILRSLQDRKSLEALAARCAQLARADALEQLIREVEPYLHGQRTWRLSLHRDRRGWDERPGVGASRAGLFHQRLGY